MTHACSPVMRVKDLIFCCGASGGSAIGAAKVVAVRTSNSEPISP